MGFSRTDVIELSELDEKKFEQLENDSGKQSDYYTFCINTGVDYRSIYSDDGFQLKDLDDQLRDYPAVHRKIVTRHLMDGIAKAIFPNRKQSILQKRSELKDLLWQNTDDPKKLISRLCSGNSAIDSENIQLIRKAVSSFLDESEFNDILGVSMYSTIPNYNYIVAMKHYKLSYIDIGKYLDVSSSAASNWGGKFCSSMHSDIIEKLAHVLGNYTLQEFRTTFISSDDLATRKCSLTLGSKLPEPPKGENRPKTGEIKKMDKIPKQDNEKVRSIDQTPKNIIKMQDTAVQVVPDIDQDKLFKLFNQLTIENQAKVKTKILELFFDQL